MKSDGVVKVAICASAIAIANLRPTYIGETQSLPVCLILVALEALILMNFYSLRQDLSLDKIPAIQVAVYVAMVTYVLARSVLDREFGADFALKAFMIDIAFIAAVILAISKREYARIFFDTFAIVIIASSVSIIITFALVAAGLPTSSLIIAHLPDPPTYPPGTGEVAFPFTHVTNEVTSWIGTAPRLAGIMREVGVFPPFACWAAAYAYLRKWPIHFIVGCLVASLLCLSTVGPLALYTGAMLLAFRLKMKPIQAALIVFGVGLIAWPVIYTMDYIGLEEKINSGTGSYEDREWLFWAVLDTQDFIFGDGARWSLVSSSAGINLVSQIREYGLIYLALVVAIYFLAMSNLRLWLAACVPALITVFFSQPVTIEPAFLMIFFSVAAFTPRRVAALRSKPALSTAGVSARPQTG